MILLSGSLIIIIIIIIIEFLTSHLWLGNIHLFWDVVINRIRLDGLICSLKSFLHYYYYHYYCCVLNICVLSNLFIELLCQVGSRVVASCRSSVERNGGNFATWNLHLVPVLAD